MTVPGNALPFDNAPQVDMLVVAPHPDDAELGMGGAILRLKSEGFKVGVLDLTDGEPTPHGSLEIRRRETAAATEILKLDWRGNLGLPNRSLQATLEARRAVASVFRQLRPRLLFAPHWTDAHPDHTAAVELVEAARFWSKLTKTDMPGEPHHPARILYYYCTHLRLVEKPAFVLDISDVWPQKLAAIECYQSQFVVGRSTEPPTLIDRLRDYAAFWGWSIGTAFGEPFASREPLGISGLRDLV
ncbi:MAG: bacillithiol biosynthesis deacetylase BshB1 [Planctomycetota bacterium]|nr:MAG: bacillithiol biosynthesis deacetylase BshB1 [Planctomycetota bacterium]